MARNAFTVIARIARNAAREAERQSRERERSYQRSLRDAEKQRATSEKQRIKDYYESRIASVHKINSELESKRIALANTLSSAIGKDLTIPFESLLTKENIQKIKHETKQTRLPEPKYKEPEWLFILKIFAWVPFLRKWLDSILASAKKSFENQLTLWAGNETIRLQNIKNIETEHALEIEAEKKRVAEHNTQVIEWKNRYGNGDPSAISEYYNLLFSNSPYPEHFPKEIKVAYSAESRLLAVEIDLPEAEKVIPKEKSFKYVKSTDTITSTNITDKSYKEAYTNLISQIALRTLYEAFFGTPNKYIDTVALNCKIKTIDPSTGRKVNPCLISTRASYTKVSFIDFNHVDPVLCLKEIKAIVSSSPSELLPVKPIIEFNMNDPRFIAETDILSGLDSRPNLMDLNPSEFESLITNLFQSMGLETKLTQASRDGGVDCVAYDPRPILGGKVVIQAKRYKNTVGVSSVRDLYGTLQNEGASKGILVTTSGYGKASYDFANGKPIELLDGNNLLYLLKEHAGIEAKIIIPAE